MNPSDTPVGSAGYKLAEHISAMANDAYFLGHPEWEQLVGEALDILKAAHPEQNPEVA